MIVSLSDEPNVPPIATTLNLRVRDAGPDGTCGPGHYTGQTLYYLEAEYRRDITSDGLLGFVVFSNVNTVTEPHTDRFSYLHPAVGAGLRVKFNKHSGTNITMDIATSKGRTAFYLGLGEVF